MATIDIIVFKFIIYFEHLIRLGKPIDETTRVHRTLFGTFIGNAIRDTLPNLMLSCDLKVLPHAQVKIESKISIRFKFHWNLLEFLNSEKFLQH